MAPLISPNLALRRLTSLLDFVRARSASGMILICSGIVAMIWANSPFSHSYFALLDFHIGTRDLQFLVNDGLMAVFFLLVGLTLRREMRHGQLASPSRLAAPAIAALGGMVVPAIIFSVFNYQDRIAMRGWAVPVATDIAFALAVIGVLGRKVPVGLTIFLTALAIIDDLGAIIVIALFYTQKMHLDALAGALILITVLWGFNRAGIRALPIYLLGGALLWMLVLRSGVHATLSGVALAFVIPMRPDEGGGSSPALRLERGLESVVAYLILPLFGLINAGLRVGALPKGALAEPLFMGTAVALVIGKQVGVFGAIMLATKLKLATLPATVSRSQLYGAAIICGIGFTMSLFIGDLAFGDSPREDEVKVAVFVGSLISAVLGLAVLAIAARAARPPTV